MITFRELADELIGIRLDATNVTLWQLQGNLYHAARTALNDALKNYPLRISRVYTSLNVPASGQVIAAVPRDFEEVQRITAVSASGSGAAGELHTYRLVKTPETHLLYVQAAAYTRERNTHIEYVSRLAHIPNECVIQSSFLSASLYVHVSGVSPQAEWHAPGYFAVKPGGASNLSTVMEVCRYEALTPTSFTGVTRNVGERSVLRNWEAGDILTPVIPADRRSVATLMHAAQAEMYAFWIRHRALYTQISVSLSDPILDADDLMKLVTFEEMRAERRYRRSDNIPQPTRVRINRRRT